MAEIRLYEDITQDTLERVAGELSAIPDGEQVDLYIASRGGELLTAMAIIDLLKSKHAYTRATIVGYAASAAAIIALSCDYVRMSPLGLLVIHSAWVDDDDGGEDEGIRRCNDYQLSIIQRRNPDLGKELFKQDNWYSADEALSLGLVDEVYSDSNRYDAACNVYAAKISNNSLHKEKVKMAKKVIKAAEIPVEEVVEQVEEREEVKEEQAVEEQPVEKKTLEDVVEALANELHDLRERIDRLEGEKKEEVVVEAACGDDEEQKQARLRAMMDRIARPQARVAIGESATVKQPVKIDRKAFAKFLND